MEELKSCPCCGSKSAHALMLPHWIVTCGNCGMRTGLYETEEQAIAAWNTRHEPHKPS